MQGPFGDGLGLLQHCASAPRCACAPRRPAGSPPSVSILSSLWSLLLSLPPLPSASLLEHPEPHPGVNSHVINVPCLDALPKYHGIKSHLKAMPPNSCWQVRSLFWSPYSLVYFWVKIPLRYLISLSDLTHPKLRFSSFPNFLSLPSSPNSATDNSNYPVTLKPQNCHVFFSMTLILHSGPFPLNGIGNSITFSTSTDTTFTACLDIEIVQFIMITKLATIFNHLYPWHFWYPCICSK